MNLNTLMLSSGLLISSNFSSFTTTDEYYDYNYDVLNERFDEADMSVLSELNSDGDYFSFDIVSVDNQITITCVGNNLIGDEYYYLNVDDIVSIKNYYLESDNSVLQINPLLGFGDYNSNTDSFNCYFSVYIYGENNTSDPLIQTPLIYFNWGGVSEHLSTDEIQSLNGADFEGLTYNDTFVSYIVNNVDLVETSNISNSVFDTIRDVVAGYSDTITNTFDGIMGIFYDSETNTLNPISTLLLIPVGIGIVLFAYYTIKRLL